MTARQPHHPFQGPDAARFSRSVRLLIVFCALTFPVVFWVLANPANARAAWAQVSRMIPFTAPVGGGTIDANRLSDAALAQLQPQQQAELLLQATIEDSGQTAATDQVSARAEAWRGKLGPSPRLKGLVNAALNSPTLDVRAAGIQVELSLNGLTEDPASANALIARIRKDPDARPWGLWMLGALGNRGIEPQRIFSVLTAYTREPKEQTRYWAVEGLSYLGQEQSVWPLLNVLRGDSSWSVRERAAGALGHSGMLTKQQRMTAVPQLIQDAGDPSLDASTQTLAYRALHDITGADVQDTPAAWQKYWTELPAR